MYKIKDLQMKGNYFSNGVIFNTKKEIREQLIKFHIKNDSKPEEIEKMTLKQILEFGEWEIEKIK